MRRRFTTVREFLHRHPAASVLVAIVLVVAPAYLRQEQLVADIATTSETAAIAADVAQDAADKATALAAEAKVTAEIAKAAAQAATQAIASAQEARDEARAVSCTEANVIAAKHNTLVEGLQNLLYTIAAPDGERSPEAQARLDAFVRHEVAKFEPIKIPARDCTPEGIEEHFGT